MLRKIVRAFALLFLLVSVVIGVFATYVWLTPSDEQRLYEQMHLEALEKLKKAEAAKGTSAGAALAKEAKDAVDWAQAWGRGNRERLGWNRLGVLASAGAALLSLVILALTFIRRKSNAGIAQPGSWGTQDPSYGEPQ